MLIMDALPDLPNIQPSMVWVAQAENAAARSGKAKELVIGSCQPAAYLEPGVDWVAERQKSTPINGWRGGTMFDPGEHAWIYLKHNEKREIAESFYPSIHDVEIVRQPRYGRVIVDKGDGGHDRLFYFPDGGYVGTDRVDFRVLVGDQPVRIVQFFKVTKLFVEGEEADRLCERHEWRISSADGINLDALTALQENLLLSTLLFNAASALAGFTDLPGLATGQTIGTQITLDTNAAGYGWYLDPTPFDNTDDFLPTADSNIWKAKPGSEAAGKMDLLSVLLHEYGHVLGLEHSANPRNFMAATLQPGERRLPSAAELQLMGELIAQIKNAALTPSPSPASGRGEQEPALPANQRTPSQTLARRRSEPSEDDVAWMIGYQAAINPTLLNGDFGPEGTDNWVAEGDIQVTGDTVTLNESPTMQTHLAQGFMVGEGDHTLSFTISAQNLTSNGKGPSDAFEVALLDANTGLPVVGAIDLTRTDALLNLQTDGTERLAPGVSKVVNPDGSATYTVALPETLAGTPVLLSFDLLGFGAAQSSITLRDIRLNDGSGPSFAPIARDDAATRLIWERP